MTRVPLASGSLRLLPSLYPDRPFPTPCFSISIRRPPARTLLTMSLRRTWHYELDSPWSRLLTWIIQAGRFVDRHLLTRLVERGWTFIIESDEITAPSRGEGEGGGGWREWRKEGMFNKKRIRGNEHGHNWRTRIVELFDGGRGGKNRHDTWRDFAVWFRLFLFYRGDNRINL